MQCVLSQLFDLRRYHIEGRVSSDVDNRKINIDIDIDIERLIVLAQCHSPIDANGSARAPRPLEPEHNYAAMFIRKSIGD